MGTGVVPMVTRDGRQHQREQLVFPLAARGGSTARRFHHLRCDGLTHVGSKATFYRVSQPH